MEAKIRKTGEKVEVCHTTVENFDYVELGFSQLKGVWVKRVWKAEELIIPEDEHWQNIRERAAIAAMQGVMNSFDSIDYNRETIAIAKLAIEQADALIEELKKKHQ